MGVCINTITLMNNKFESTYAPLTRSEEKGRKALQTSRYFAVTLSVMTRVFFIIATLCSSGGRVAKAQDDNRGCRARAAAYAGRRVGRNSRMDLEPHGHGPYECHVLSDWE